MKRRAGFVSNSSSSSFVVINWSQLDEAKKDMVLNYMKHVRETWEKNHLPISNEPDAHIDMENVPNPFPPDDVIDDIQRNVQWQKEHENDYRLYEIAQNLDFGWLDGGWRFREKDGVLDMTTSMDNFDMEKWMDYIGGIKYRWTGENWGLFPGEEFKIDTDFLKELDKNADAGAEGLHQDA